jgi:succinate-acetate transporter protein
MEKMGNPGPIGLLGFGMTTVLLNIHNAGFTSLDDHILAMGIFVGGLAQVIAGILENKRGNTFASTAFTLYGFFWIALVWMVYHTHSAAGLATYLLIWGIFSFFMFIGTLNLNKALQVIFGTLVILFALLAIGNYTLAAGNAVTGKLILNIAGFEGIICGASAMYLAFAEVLNEVYGREVLPIGAKKQ